MALLRNVGTTLEMIKWEHSIFALPFALAGAMLAAAGWPSWAKLFWIIVCMVTARSAGMAFNRWADAALDAANPRTAARAIPAGIAEPPLCRGFHRRYVAGLLAAAAQLNRETLLLSPLVLAVLLLYSYTKRFTRWSHLVLGLALGIAPAAAWIAIRGALDPRIVVLTVAVLFWVGGFDVLYACQDMAHDREAGLNSIPGTWGIQAAFWIARAMHLVMLGLLCWLLILFALNAIAWAGVAAVGILLLYEHLIISPTDLRRLNAAFFTMNGIISMVFFFLLPLRFCCTVQRFTEVPRKTNAPGGGAGCTVVTSTSIGQRQLARPSSPCCAPLPCERRSSR